SFNARAAVDRRVDRTAAYVSDEAKRKFSALMVVAGKADESTLQKDRVRLLREFMAKSADFILEYPEHLGVWAMRAVAAVELDYPGAGWLAGQRLKQLERADSKDEKLKKIMVELKRKGWLGEQRTWRDWSAWTTAQAKAAAEEGDVEAQDAMGDWYARGASGL